MSAWYVLSALGLYSVCPGTDQYVIGSPLFTEATISLENGRQFTIEAKNNSPENIYIQAATLNGRPFTASWIDYATIMQGGRLVFEMGDQPALERGTRPADLPFSLTPATKSLPAKIK